MTYSLILSILMRFGWDECVPHSTFRLRAQPRVASVFLTGGLFHFAQSPGLMSVRSSLACDLSLLIVRNNRWFSFFSSVLAFFETQLTPQPYFWPISFHPDQFTLHYSQARWSALYRPHLIVIYLLFETSATCEIGIPFYFPSFIPKKAGDCSSRNFEMLWI